MTISFSHKRAAVCCLVVAALVMPLTASAGIGDILSLLTGITSTLKSEVGLVLSQIQTLHATVSNFEQQVIWPVTLMNQARSSVNQIRAQFSTLAGQVHSIQINSARLQNPSRFEALIRGGQASNLDQIGPSYAQVYLPLPQADKVTVAQRNLVDVDDAFSLEALKTATVSDQASEQLLTAADGLEKEIVASSPGSAEILSAQALVANLESQAMLHKMLAADLRQYAASLAHGNALRRQSTEATKNLRTNLQQILNRR